MGCYVYCFCEVPAPEIQQDLGIGGSPVRAIDYDGIAAVTAESFASPAPSVQNVIAHNRVINSLLRFTTPIPCRFGAILSAQDLHGYLAANGPALKTLLERVRGCVEMALRITWNPRDADSQIDRGIDGLSPQVALEPGGAGTRFLEEKLRQAVYQELADEKARAILGWADSRFGALVKDRVARLRPDTAMVADIAHLVERADVERYRELFRGLAAERTDVRLSSSGVWAPYSFAIVDTSPRSRR